MSKLIYRWYYPTLCHAAADQRGSIAIVFALSIAMITFSCGVAIDFARGHHTKAALQNALDAGVLAASKLPMHASGSAIQDRGTKYFDIAVAGSGVMALVNTPVFSRTNGAVEASVHASVATTLTHVLGFDSLPVDVRSVAASHGNGMELMLILDVSSSMSGSKIAGLRTAGVTLIDAIYQGASSRPKTWIGITPFSGRVNIGDYGATWMTGANPNGFGSGSRICTGVRPGTYEENAAPPSVSPFPYYTGDEVKCPDPKVVGLTADPAIVRSAIEALFVGSGTSTQTGMVWGWRMLSPQWQGLWGSADLPKAAADTPGKYVIIMTDGENFPDDAGYSYDTEEADARLLRECQAMKAEGITIFTVAFDMGASLTSLYQQCASTVDYHFDVETVNDLVETFANLGMTIAGNSVRLTN